MATPDASAEYYRAQQRIAVATAGNVSRLFSRMTDDFEASWARMAPSIVNLTRNGMLAAAQTSTDYVPALLAETGEVDAPTGVIAPSAFTRTAPDGRALGSLLNESVIKAKTAVGRGMSPQDALTVGRKFLTTTTLTVVADTSRAVVAADIAQRPDISGYVRMLNAPSCSRCVILAGKWFRWNEGFRRHPRCDCRHIPSSEDAAGDLRTDPYEYFGSLNEKQQDKLFGRSEARAIRAGGDIYRVANISERGLATAKGKLRYGTPSRITVDDIFRTAGTRTNAIRMLEQEGYITGPQVRGGNILGRFREGAGQLGKGGRARAATDAVVAARRTGVRDPLNRYTMTAAERRLYDAKTRLDIARTGINPRSIGANSADLKIRTEPITPERLRVLQRDYERELAKLDNAPESVKRLARALGIRT